MTHQPVVYMPLRALFLVRYWQGERGLRSLDDGGKGVNSGGWV